MQNRIVALVFAVAAIAVVPAANAGRMCPTGAVERPTVAGGPTTRAERILVTYRAGTGSFAGNRLSSFVESYDRVRPGVVAFARKNGTGTEVLKVAAGTSRFELDRILSQLKADPRVEYAGIDGRFSLQAGPPIANDTLYPQQWNLQNTAVGVGAANAWSYNNPYYPMVYADGYGAVVAVIDTGIAANPDLDGNVVPGYDFVADPAMSRDGDGRDADASDPGDWTMSYNPVYCINVLHPSTWHGTHVAGIVAATTGNSRGIASMAPRAKVMPVRVFGVEEDPTEGSSHVVAFESDIIDAITWASGGYVSGAPTNNDPVEAINLSLGMGGACSAPMQAAINGAVSRGTVIVVASGNGNEPAANGSPGSCQNVIVVGASNTSGGRASFSNYGATVDVSAPGTAINSTVNGGNKQPTASEAYKLYDGTSMAAPHVAGLVALMQAFNPNTPAYVEQLIKTYAKPMSVACPEGCGAGIINAQATIQAIIPICLNGAANGTQAVCPPPPGPGPLSNKRGLTGKK